MSLLLTGVVIHVKYAGKAAKTQLMTRDCVD
jgi:hypothetical protein